MNSTTKCNFEQLGKEAMDIFFIFMNITPFAKHERLLFLPGSADLVQKEKNS